MSNIEENKKKIIERLILNQRKNENSKYGEFIIQTNKVQFYLVLLILTKAIRPNKKLKNNLERLELGHLIGYFRVCAKSSDEVALIQSLEKYKDSRNALAHRMFIKDKKLTIRECELSIQLGEEILKVITQCLEQYIRE